MKTKREIKKENSKKRFESSVYDTVATKPTRFTLRSAKESIELKCNI